MYYKLPAAGWCTMCLSTGCTKNLKIKRNEINNTYNDHYLTWFNNENKIIWDA